MFFEVALQIFNTILLLLILSGLILFFTVLRKLNKALDIWLQTHKKSEKGS